MAMKHIKKRIQSALALLALVGACITAVLATRAWHDLRAPVFDTKPISVSVEWASVLSITNMHWEVWSGDPGPVAATEPSSGGAYRLAGTFISFDSDMGVNEVRKAIIDDTTTDRQVLVSTGDPLGQWTVEEIRSQSVKLNHEDGRTQWLSLNFEDSESGGEGSLTSVTESVPEPEALEVSSFGKRVGDNRWILDRQALLDYYDDVLDDPKRLANLFLSMQDVKEQGETRGYRYQPTAETELFTAVGLQENDVVRTVNSMRMTSARRSQYLLQAFIQGRLNTFVFDIEREGEEQKLIYLIR